MRYIVGVHRREFIDNNGNQFHHGISEYAPHEEGRTPQSATRKFMRVTKGWYGDGWCWDSDEERYVYASERY